MENKQNFQIAVQSHYSLYNSLEQEDRCLCFPEQVDMQDLIVEEDHITDVKLEVRDNSISIDALCSALIALGFNFTGAKIYIQNSLDNDFVFVGFEPFNKSEGLSDIFWPGNVIKIKAFVILDTKYFNSGIDGKVRLDDVEKKSMSQRNKERSVGFIVEKVCIWRKLYNGFNDEHGHFVKYTLDQAADKLDISKKSLDDYLLQLRLGKKYGYDFNLNKDKKVGHLRNYIKDQKKLHPEDTKKNSKPKVVKKQKN